MGSRFFLMMARLAITRCSKRSTLAKVVVRRCLNTSRRPDQTEIDTKLEQFIKKLKKVDIVVKRPSTHIGGEGDVG